MIRKKDVVRIKVPFPDISSDLATNSHMYICREAAGNTYRFIKCQTLKPYMLYSSIFAHYWDELPDITRNPFARETRIDCDKEFVTTGVQYSDALKTPSRPDVCEDVMSHVVSELLCDGYDSNLLDEHMLVRLNYLITAV